MSDDYFYDLFVDAAQKSGVEAATAQWKKSHVRPDGVVDDYASRYLDNVKKIHDGGPVIITPREDRSWYQGPTPSDPAWNALVAELERIGRGDQIPSLDSSSSKVVGETPNPAGPARTARGLVVGYVQSGKTTNFTAVAAKLADCGYRAVIVLSGIHNALRRQTQERLNEQLVALNPGKWFEGTTVEDDFRPTSSLVPHLSATGQTTLIVAKKNARVLERLRDWFQQPSARQALTDAKILVIDDEADQASVATGSINPLIRDILRTMPRATYIGYTATPFANVFIDPADSDDLYPRDFILNLPRPENYFGPEKIFGRTDADPERDDVEGYDMIRLIPEEDEPKMRPFGKGPVDNFVPVITPEIRQAVQWFLLATAARFHRGQNDHSSMLVHTSFKTQVHEAFRAPIEALIEEHRSGVSGHDPKLLEELRQLWNHETARVPASLFGREAEKFDDLLGGLGRTLGLVRVVIDNSASDDRLIYPKHGVAVSIAIGGNTLSRGLTLEGLISSVFIRPSNTYDTLLQMGRWFGFRIGYEDLPRIWMTPSLRNSFRHLSMVEHEMRSDIDSYQLQNQTPMEVAVRVRTHPALRITAKMGAAVPARTSYSSTRLQTRFFEHQNAAWLRTNIDAAEQLIRNCSRQGGPDTIENNFVFRDVPVSHVKTFLGEYQVRPESNDMDPTLVTRYIDSRLRMDEPELSKWNVAVIAGSGTETTLDGLSMKANIRSQLNDLAGEDPSKPYADIKTLMSKEDMVVDLNSIDQTTAKKKKESELKAARSLDDEYSKHGLLALYPIDPKSAPAESRRRFRTALNAVDVPIGLALVFPHTADDTFATGSVRTTHVAVELLDDRETLDVTEELYGDD